MRGDEERPLLVIGVGNPYRGDDGAGIVVARKLKDLGLLGMVTREESGEGSSLIEAWANATSAVIVDAVSSGSAAGTIHRLDAHSRPIPTDFFHYSSHSFGVAEAIEVARALNELPQRLDVFGIEGGGFTAGDGLSPEVERAVDEVVSSIVHTFRLHAHQGVFPLH